MIFDESNVLTVNSTNINNHIGYFGVFSEYKDYLKNTIEDIKVKDAKELLLNCSFSEKKFGGYIDYDDYEGFSVLTKINTNSLIAVSRYYSYFYPLSRGLPFKNFNELYRWYRAYNGINDALPLIYLQHKQNKKIYAIMQYIYSNKDYNDSIMCLNTESYDESVINEINFVDILKRYNIVTKKGYYNCLTGTVTIK